MYKDKFYWRYKVDIPIKILVLSFIKFRNTYLTSFTKLI